MQQFKVKHSQNIIDKHRTLILYFNHLEQLTHQVPLDKEGAMKIKVKRYNSGQFIYRNKNISFAISICL